MADLLIIDDDLDIAEVLAALMQLEGHRVRVGRNGREGLSLLYACKPDLVLLDVEMPVLTGPEMAYSIVIHDAGYEKIPILLLSGVLDLKAVAATVGTPYYIGKPFRLDALLPLVEMALRERRSPSPAGVLAKVDGTRPAHAHA